ncbi:MAG: translation initiation factor IF-3, partial [Betaproteobacteria bacterium]|nr:translation initiation factor IF-3 [Betaproteobacteria bacterium]
MQRFAFDLLFPLWRDHHDHLTTFKFWHRLQASPPVVKLMDYGKFRYQEQKRAAEAKSKQKTIQVKEIKFRPGTDDGDYHVKLRNLIRF